MRNNTILMAVCISLLMAGCATVGPVKGSATSNAIYTDAPIEIAYESACQALQNLGYKIEMKDKDNYFVKGTYYNPLTGYSPLIAKIDVSKEVSGAKIIYDIDQEGTIKALDITGYYVRCGNNIYQELIKILGSKGYKLQKSW